MSLSNRIQVFEYDWLVVNHDYTYIDSTGKTFTTQFKEGLYKRMALYATENASCPYYSVYLNKIRFRNYVGIIQVNGVTIEVLPKTDRHKVSKQDWQAVLFEMFKITMAVKAKITTEASIHLKQFTVLEGYLQLFLQETEKVLHAGLIKKYRKQTGNQTALKGRLLVHKQVTQNMVHAERFFVSYTIFDQKNIYNAILVEALQCIRSLTCSMNTTKWCEKLLLNFPECNKLKIAPSLFDHLVYDRKTSHYKTAIDLAKIILLNYHPDVKGGNNNMLAIMFDMNRLWESYIYAMLRKAAKSNYPNIKVTPQRKQLFWQKTGSYNLSLKPDILIYNKTNNKSLVLDTKWKFRKDTSMEDIRQMFAYGHYFKSAERYLLYPDKLKDKKVVDKHAGSFYDLDKRNFSATELCGLLFIDLLKENGKLNKEVGSKILEILN